jgi:hypothetical protein
VLAHEDLPGLGELLHALRQADRVTLRRVVHAQVVANPADHDLARVEPDPDPEAEPTIETQFGRMPPQLLRQVQRRPARPLRVILVRNRGAEKRH